MGWNTDKGRADCENRIKELKADFGFDPFNMQHFAATEAALNFVVIAYNILSLFKQAVLQTNTLHQLKTLRYKIFAIGGYITKSGNQRLLNLSLNMKQRKWIQGIWIESLNFSWPFVPTSISNENSGLKHLYAINEAIIYSVDCVSECK
jgi:hypothetical protein